MIARPPMPQGGFKFMFQPFEGLHIRSDGLVQRNIYRKRRRYSMWPLTHRQRAPDLLFQPLQTTWTQSIRAAWPVYVESCGPPRAQRQQSRGQLIASALKPGADSLREAQK